MSVEPVATVVSGNTYTLDTRYDLSESRILGKGSFGVVCTAKDTIRGITLAIKRIRPYANDDWDAKHTLREVKLMRLLGAHPNVITLYELSLFLPKTELYMMIEVMDSDLHRVIQSSKPLSTRHVKCFIKQMLEGIKAMHSIGVLHRDLKPGNILVSKDCQLRITDFGLARFMDEQTKAGDNSVSPMTQYVVTRWYRPPELLLAPNLPYGEAVDLWSIGCILAELINRKALFPGKDHLNQVDLIFQLFGYTDETALGFPIDPESASVLRNLTKHNKQDLTSRVPNACAEAVSLMECLLSVNPAHRPSAQEALLHPFLSDAEVLHDYSKTYLTRPPTEYFDFEYTPYTVPQLRSMIHEEVRQLSAVAYRTTSSQYTHANSPNSQDSLTPGELSATSGSGVKRRGSETDNSTTNSGGLVSGENKAAQDALNDGEGPASQLPTARIFNGVANNKAINNDSIYMMKNTSNQNIQPGEEKNASRAAHHGDKEKKDNPFRSHPHQEPPAQHDAADATAAAATATATAAASMSTDTANTYHDVELYNDSSAVLGADAASATHDAPHPAVTATVDATASTAGVEHKKDADKPNCCVIN